jgi:acyl carrier protein
MTTPDNAQTIATLQSWFVAQIAEQTEMEPEYVEVDLPFENFGLDSAQALSIAHKAEKTFGVELSAAQLWHYPTIASLSQRIAEDVTLSEDQLLQQADPEVLAKLLAEIEQG